MLGVTYKTAWFMLHRIREAMTTNPDGLLRGGGSTVEVDKTYWGNTHQSKIGKLVGTKQGGHQKEKIVSMAERGGLVRSFHVETVSPSTLKEVMEKNIHKDTQIHTDEHYAYRNSTKGFAGHEFVNHGPGEYVRDDVTTNSIEGSFSIFKRGLIGTFHHVGEQHLQRYCNEFDFRYNSRTKLGFNDVQRTDIALKRIEGKRLTYRRVSGQWTVQATALA